MKKEKTITVVSVNWYSSEHIKRLLNNLRNKADNINALTFMIVDNTNGADVQLQDAVGEVPFVTILPNEPERKQRSEAHASALDTAMQQLETSHTLVVDPDVYIFKKGWDSFCLNEIESGKTSVGAPYPKWKLGKVHDFPSVVFIFARTDWFTEEGLSWFPFPPLWHRTWNFFVRKVVRLFRFAKRSRLENSRYMRMVTSGLEAMTGITSPDTGWHFIKAAKERGDNCTVFQVPYAAELPSDSESMIELARNFELFLHNDEPFMSHMYSSGIAYYRTKKGGDPEAWLSAVSEVERSYN